MGDYSLYLMDNVFAAAAVAAVEVEVDGEDVENTLCVG
jgi:hypothetical protein